MKLLSLAKLHVVGSRGLMNRLRSQIDYLNKQNPNIMTFIIYGLLYDIVINMYKPFLAKFMQRLGGGEFYISLLNALPGIVAALTLIPGAILISRFKNKKLVTTVFFLIARIFLLIIAFVPLMPEGLRPLLCVVLISLMNFPEALSQTSLQGMLAMVFDGRVRSYALSMRTKMGYIMVIIVTLASGLILGRSSDNVTTIRIYQIFFILAFLVGMVEIFIFNRFKISKDATQQTRTHLSAIKDIVKNKEFLRFFATSLLFTFFWQMGWPLCTIYQIKTLGANEIWLALFAVGSGLISFLTASRWNKVISKKGNFYALFFAMFSLAINLFLFPISPNLYVMMLASLFGGFCVVGINICILNGLLEMSPDENRLVYISFYNTFSNLCLFISPFVSYFLLNAVSIRPALYIVSFLRGFGCLIFYLQYRSKITSSERGE